MFAKWSSRHILSLIFFLKLLGIKSKTKSFDPSSHWKFTGGTTWDYCNVFQWFFYRDSNNWHRTTVSTSCITIQVFMDLQRSLFCVLCPPHDVWEKNYYFLSWFVVILTSRVLLFGVNVLALFNNVELRTKVCLDSSELAARLEYSGWKISWMTRKSLGRVVFRWNHVFLHSVRRLQFPEFSEFSVATVSFVKFWLLDLCELFSHVSIHFWLKSDQDTSKER